MIESFSERVWSRQNHSSKIIYSSKIVGEMSFIYQDINRIAEGIYIQTHERFKEPISLQQYCDLTSADGIDRLNLN